MEELRPLIAEGQERGHLTIDRITSFLEEVEITKEQVLELHSVMEEQGIEILGSDGQPLKSDSRLQQDSTDTDRQAFKAADPQAKPQIDLTVEPSLDSLRLYLRSIGRVQLLTAEREVSLAQ